jgi:hypothetical protein
VNYILAIFAALVLYFMIDTYEPDERADFMEACMVGSSSGRLGADVCANKYSELTK